MDKYEFKTTAHNEKRLSLRKKKSKRIETIQTMPQVKNLQEMLSFALHF